MSDYRRPAFPTEVYRDEQGNPIEYGNRWGAESPPMDSYSRVSNLQRFLPLHAVAGALIAWLQDTFEVSVVEDPEVTTDLLHLPNDVVRAVRVVPASPTAAPLTFVLTRFPGVFLHAGSLHDFHFPACGCDACDHDATRLAEDLEWTVRLVISGCYFEQFDQGPGRWVEFRLEEPEVGIRSGRSLTKDLPETRVKLARTALPSGGQWAPWERRS
ncbi:hypothetical protein AL755_11950 [Arthrobacter sp. ERGS1:01]|uniref:DUF6226 family protein n=1 Tax=Arthrobacter sp. ERGS1:01 TaxID=1704044 RepID=UPI0006B48486|nr:DUF6226 family protein [Arthrobacter sp. ERGS1:01]ALE06021.1 hypothetical protein AL755_11950 [Arthrobacter sp. ERGS1:01]